MNDSRSARWAPLTGIAFVVLYVVGILLTRIPDSNDPLEQISAYYGTDKGNRVQTIVAAYVLIAAGLLFLGFLSSLRSRLRTAEGEDGTLTSVAFAAGILFVGLFVAGVLAIAAVPGSISFGGAEAPSGDVVNTFQSLGYGLILIGAMLSAAVMIFATSIVTLRTHVLPAWSAWLGFVAAIALLFAALWIPQIALLIWTLAVSGTMAVQRGGAPRVAYSA
jgi:hypothetical protein